MSVGCKVSPVIPTHKQPRAGGWDQGRCHAAAVAILAQGEELLLALSPETYTRRARLAALENLRREHRIDYPFILKPPG